MDLLSQEVVDATKKKFEEDLENRVTLVLFTQEPQRLVVPDYLKGQECRFCKETRQLVEEISNLSDKIDLKIYDFEGDKEKVSTYGIDKIPAIAVRGEKDFGIRFYGIPSGYEYTSLIEAIIDVSTGRTDLSQKTKDALSGLSQDFHIQVFVSPTCPYCPLAVRLAHQFAFESDRIRADMVESTEFPYLAQKYSVLGVPKTIINENVSVDGAVPEEQLLESLLKPDTPEDREKNE
jgi:glutaredoxin-like protein